jgi:hypothetical protein
MIVLLLVYMSNVARLLMFVLGSVETLRDNVAHLDLILD